MTDPKEYQRKYRQAHREENRAYQKVYHQAHREEQHAKAKAYRAQNKEQIAEAARRYYRENKEKIKAKRRKDYAANPEKVIAANQRWAARNLEKVAKYNQKARRKYYAGHRDELVAKRRARDGQIPREKYLKLVRKASRPAVNGAKAKKDRGKPQDRKVQARLPRIKELVAAAKTWGQIQITMNRELDLNLSKRAYRNLLIRSQRSRL